MSRSRRARILRTSGAILAFIGVALLAWCLWLVVRMRVYQEQSRAALDREILYQPVKLKSGPPPKEGALLGSISIPRVGISSVILQGTDDRTLGLSVGHIPGTALPGAKGNVALAGHRDTFFRGLQNIRDGDGILITTPAGSRLYEVESTRIVSPEDVFVLDDVGRPLLTLVTCYPFHYIGAAPKRFIVQAHPAG